MAIYNTIQLPILEELAEEIGNEITIAKVNVDKEKELASRYEIMSIPTQLLYKNGNVIERKWSGFKIKTY
jgi:thioredoxin 1